MPSARDEFLGRLQALEDAVSHDSLVAKAPSEWRHNARADITRNGLAVLCFVVLEDFLRERAREAIARIPTFGLSFQQLPPGLRRLTTVGAANAIRSYIQRQSELDEISVVQDLCKQIGSTLMPSYDLCTISFGFQDSNISEVAVMDFLTALSIDKPWETISYAAKVAGIGSLILKGGSKTYQDLSRQRHRAAHNPRTNIQPSDLMASIIDIRAIALGFDCLISTALVKLMRHDSTYLSFDSKITSKHIKMRFVDEISPTRYLVKGHTDSRHRKFGSHLDAMNFACAKIINTDEFLVERDNRSVPKKWRAPHIQ